MTKICGQYPIVRMNGKKILLLAGFFFSFGLSFSVVGAWAKDGGAFDAGQIVEVNNSLKNVIEENQKLSQANVQLEEQVNQMRDDFFSGLTELKSLKQEKERLAQNVRQAEDKSQRFYSEMQRLQSDLQALAEEKDSSVERARYLEQQLAGGDSPEMREDVILLAQATPQEVKDREDKTLDLLSKIDAFSEEDERLRGDAAKAHYNMGNIYFERGEYEIAAREYYQAVALMPDDPDSHFNLAFVSGEHLGDFKTARKHYQMYLYLNPEAKDRSFAKEKILEADLHLRNVTPSPLEKSLEKSQGYRK